MNPVHSALLSPDIVLAGYLLSLFSVVICLYSLAVSSLSILSLTPSIVLPFPLNHTLPAVLSAVTHPPLLYAEGEQGSKSP